MTSRDDNDIGALLGALRQAQSSETAPARVERAVMNAWDAVHPRVARGRFTVASRIASMAAAAALAVGLGALGEHLRSAQIAVPRSAAETPPTVILVGAPLVDGEQMHVVRMRMPLAALHTLGVRSTGSSLDDVDVDVIVGEDGVARALSLNP